jgi:hypothetical protein
MFNYPDYFEALGIKIPYYTEEKNEFNKEAIMQAVDSITQKWKAKYPDMKFKTDRLNFTSKTALNQSFTTEIEGLNLETK